jgi:hypothetical protein
LIQQFIVVIGQTRQDLKGQLAFQGSFDLFHQGEIENCRADISRRRETLKRDVREMP